MEKDLSVGGHTVMNGFPPDIEFLPDFQGSAGDAFNLLGAEVRDDLAPLTYRRVADPERPRDIRGFLKVIENVFFEHGEHSTTVKTWLQPQEQVEKLTLVAMKSDHSTLAGRLAEAMGDEITASELARACHVSPAAVGKWLNGTTKKLHAETLIDAARALGVSQDWLRTGKLPRERSSDLEARDADKVMRLLEAMQAPLAELSAAILALKKTRSPADKKQSGT